MSLNIPKNPSKDDPIQFLVVGGGNAAHVMAAYASAKPYVRCHVLSTFMDEAERMDTNSKEAGGITCKNDLGPDVTGLPAKVSKDPAEVVPGSHIIMITLPSFTHEMYMKLLQPHISEGCAIGAMPAKGGIDLAAKPALGDFMSKIVIFGMDTLPWACRVTEFGKHVHVLGTKGSLKISVSPPSEEKELVPVLEDLLGVKPKLKGVGSILTILFMNIGQLFHPIITYGRFRNWDGKPLKESPLFYQGLDEFTADKISACSDEVVALKDVLMEKYPDCDLSAVVHVSTWMQDSYSEDIEDDTNLYTSIRTNKAYTGLTHPMVEVEGGLAPNFNYRYMTEEIPFGLTIIRGIAELADFATPNIDEVIEWSQTQMNKEYLVNGKMQGKDIQDCRCPQRFGFKDLDSFMRDMRYTQA